MPNLDFSKQATRLAVSGAAVAVGALASAVLPPGAEVLAPFIAALTGLAGNVTATDLHQGLARRLSRSDRLLLNHDLAQAAGDAVSRLLKHAARETDCGKQGKSLKKLAKATAKNWTDIAEAKKDQLEEIDEPALPENFMKGAEIFAQQAALAPEEWKNLLVYLDARYLTRGWLRNEHLSDACMSAAAQLLHMQFFFTLREILKEDFRQGGKAYAGLLLTLIGEIAADVKDIKAGVGETDAHGRHTAAEVLEVKKLVKQLIASAPGAVAGIVSAMDPGEQKRHEELFEWLCTIGDRSRDVMDGIAGVKREVQAGIGMLADQLAEQHSQVMGAIADRWPTKVEPVKHSELIGAFPNDVELVGRKQELETLADLLRNGKRAWLCGMAGAGKSFTAIKYAYDHQMGYTALFWAGADTRQTLLDAFGRFADRLGLPRVDGMGNSVDSEGNSIAVRNARLWLQAHPGWLMIFDNLNDLELLPDFEPPSNSGALIYTLRDELEPPKGETIPINQMSEPDGVKLLLSKAELPEQEHSEPARSIFTEFDGLALALSQAGAYMKVNGLKPVDYLARYQREKGTLLRDRGSKLERYPLAVFYTVEQALKSVQSGEGGAQSVELLRLCAFLAPAAIPLSLFRDGAESLPPQLQGVSPDSPAWDKLLRPLTRLGLLRIGAERETVSLHRLTRDILQLLVPNDDHAVCEERVVNLVGQAFPIGNYDAWEQCERLMPHARQCEEYIRQRGIESLLAARLLHQTGSYLYDQGRYAEAEPLYKQALDIRKKALSEGHPDIATSLNNLAGLYKNQGRYAEAEPLYKQALGIRKKALSKGHPDIGASLNNLALLYHSQGRYAEAEPLLKRALAIMEKALPGDHPDIATSLNNLAGSYKNQGHYAEAEPLYKRALDIRKKALSKGHPDIATSLNNLALLYHSQGRYAKAEPLYKRALAIMEKALPGDHPNLATITDNYAAILLRRGKHDEARDYHERAEAIRAAHENRNRQP